MGEVVTEIMKGHLSNKLPFLVTSLLFELRPEMLDASLRKVVGTPLSSQPGRALAGKNV